MKSFFYIIILLIFGGCATNPPIKAAFLQLDTVEKLKVGVTTEQNTVDLFGAADKADLGTSEAVWRYDDKASGFEVLTIAFDRSTKILKWIIWQTKFSDANKQLSQLFQRYPNLKVQPTPVAQDNPHMWVNEEYYRDDKLAHQFALVDTKSSEVMTIGWYDPSARATAGEKLAQKKHYTIGGL